MMETADIKVTILKTFRDKDNFAMVYKAGSEAGFTAKRADELNRLGLVDFGEPEPTLVPEPAPELPLVPVSEPLPAPEPEPVKVIVLSQAWQKVVSDVKACKNAADLDMALIAEVNSSNRKTVVEALNARIAELNTAE